MVGSGKMFVLGGFFVYSIAWAGILRARHVWTYCTDGVSAVWTVCCF